MATDLEQMVLSISADTRQAVRALKKFGVDVEGVANDTEKAFRRPTRQIDALSTAMGKSTAQTANLAAQFQDIAVQLQAGQSPFQIALQQGTQISGALGNGQGGLRGVVGALGGAFAALVSPVSLATIALIALGGIGINYLTDMLSGTEDLDDQLKAHKSLISSIKDAYGDALDGVEVYAKESTAVLQAQARASAALLGETLKSETQNILKSSGSFFIDPNDIIGDKETFQVKARFQVFSDAILALRKSAQEGEPDIRTFRNAVADIANADPSNKSLQAVATALLDMSNDAGRASDALTATQRAISATASVASGSLGAIKEYRDALADLAKVALPTLSPRQQADAAYARAISNASSPGARAAADAEYVASLERISAAEKKVEDERKAREAESASRRAGRKAERDQERIDDIIKRLQDEATQIGATARQQAIYNAVAAAGVDINSRYGEQISGLAGRLYDLESAQAEAVKSMDDMREASSDVLGGFARDLRNGVSAAEALQNALGKIGDKLLDIAIQDTIGGLFGKSGTTGGGLLGNLFGGLLGGFKGFFADGGTLGAGQWGIAGEAGPEIVRGPAGISPMARSGGSMTAQISIDLSGANGDRAIEAAAQRGALAGAAIALKQTPGVALKAVGEQGRRRS